MGSPGHITVAVVDDDESLCRSLGRLLRESGFEPVAFSSAEAFLAAGPGGFDCVVLDIQLGGMSGVELQDHLTASGCQLPVVFITAGDDPDLRARAIASDCAGYFHKTDPGERVVECIRQAASPSPLS